MKTRNRKIANVFAGTEVEGPDVVEKQDFLGPIYGRLQSAPPRSQSAGLLIGVTSPGGAACSSTQPLRAFQPDDHVVTVCASQDRRTPKGRG